jgi:hypothetical protein
MIRVMTSPFRFNKKQRRNLRRDAKSSTKVADKFEAEGTKSQAVVVLRGVADFSTRMSLARRRRKKSKNSS